MGGEMNLTGTFDVTNLECWEVQDPGNEILSNIIDVGEDFYLKAYFEGSGDLWTNMTNARYEYVVRFYAEGMGFNVPNINLNETTGNLVPGQLVYEVDSPTDHIDDEGIYRCGVTVTFRTADGADWPGVLGFNEDCVIQVSPMEEP
jgi:hypothetical protein